MDSGPYSAQALLEAARSLAPQISAAGDEIERQRHVPAGLLASLKAAGLYRMLVPRSVGGAELTLHEFAEVIFEVASADASTAWCMSQNSGICGMSGYMPSQGLHEIFGQHDMIVSWGNGPMTALEVNGGYRLSGRWVFSSGIHNAVWAGAHNAPLVDQRGEPVLDASGQPRRLTMFFPVEDIELTDVWQVSGLRGTGSDSYTVTDLFVPAHRVALDRAAGARHALPLRYHEYLLHWLRGRGGWAGAGRAGGVEGPGHQQVAARHRGPPVRPAVRPDAARRGGGHVARHAWLPARCSREGVADGCQERRPRSRDEN